MKNYLQTVWNIAPERMTIEARNLPAKPSSIKLKEGQAENRRVEILSTDPAILAPIRSTYLATRIDASALTLRPEVDSRRTASPAGRLLPSMPPGPWPTCPGKVRLPRK